jgi:hypothetical protein
LCGDEARETSTQDKDAVWGWHGGGFSFDRVRDLDVWWGPLIPLLVEHNWG